MQPLQMQRAKLNFAFACYFGGDAASWLQLQSSYDLKTISTQDEIMTTVTPRVVEAV